MLTPELPWHRGEAALPDGERSRFEVCASTGGVSHVRFSGAGDPGDLEGPVRAWLAAAGFRPLEAEGDTRPVWVGAPDDEPPSWPTPFRRDATSRDLRDGRLTISRASARALRKGHPWILWDPETGATDGWPPGALVRLVDPGGRLHGLARLDGDEPVAARVWARDAEQARDAESIEARVARALARRAALAGAGEPFRAIHGEADGLPGLHVDVLGSGLRVQIVARSALPLRERVIGALQARLAPRFVVEVVHLRRRPPGRLECVRLAEGLSSPQDRDALAAGIEVEEAGLVFRADLGLAEWDRPRPGVGFFLDQREARKVARERTRPGGRYLNLFAHTGAFSAVLLAAGAGLVTSVDLSGAYLGWLEENLARNGLLDGRHRPVQRDVRSFLAEARAEAPANGFDGIVLDPPTAASAGRRFLATRRELLGLVESALGLLRPGGWLYVSRNDRKGRGRLGRELAEVARAAGRGPIRIEPGAIPPDFPSLRGFVEGDPFEAFWLQLSQ